MNADASLIVLIVQHQAKADKVMGDTLALLNRVREHEGISKSPMLQQVPGNTHVCACIPHSPTKSIASDIEQSLMVVELKCMLLVLKYEVACSPAPPAAVATGA